MWDEQVLVGTPDALVLDTPAHYSFGSAVGPDGTVWFTEFNHQQLRRYDPKTGQTKTQRKGLPGLYGIAIDREGVVFLGQDLGDRENPGRVLRIDPRTGKEDVIVTGLTRPRQLACDPAGNLLIVCEAGSTQAGPSPALLRWERATGEVVVLWRDLVTPQGIAVAPDGRVFLSEYGVAGEKPGRVLVRTPSGAVRTLADGFWRARGLALVRDQLYLTTEANVGDQGNSGLLVRIATTSGQANPVLTGIDYPQFPAAHPSGAVYFAINRDSWLTHYSPEPVAKVGKATVTLTVENVTITRQSAPEQGWHRLSAELLPLNPNELYTDRGDPEHPQPGLFTLPKVTVRTRRGGGWGAAIAVRGHRGKRFPMRFVGTAREAPPADFNESPVAYLVFYRLGPPPNR